jgi:hypothetical protein
MHITRQNSVVSNTFRASNRQLIVGLPSPGTTRPSPRRSVLCYPSRWSNSSVTFFPRARWHLSSPSSGRNVGLRRALSLSLLSAGCFAELEGVPLEIQVFLDLADSQGADFEPERTGTTPPPTWSTEAPASPTSLRTDTPASQHGGVSDGKRTHLVARLHFPLNSEHSHPHTVHRPGALVLSEMLGGREIQKLHAPAGRARETLVRISHGLQFMINS